MSNGASLDYTGQNLGDVLSKVNKDKGEVFGAVILQKTVFQILTNTVKNTRVDTGALRANWQVSRNLRNSSNLTVTSKTGKGAISRGRRVVKQIRVTDTVFIQNNLEYAEHWERVDKMLKDSIQQVTRNLNKSLDKARL